MGGWGTFCHGGERNLARGLTDEYAVLCIDYRGICDSTDAALVLGKALDFGPKFRLQRDGCAVTGKADGASLGSRGAV